MTLFKTVSLELQIEEGLEEGFELIQIIFYFLTTCASLISNQMETMFSGCLLLLWSNLSFLLCLLPICSKFFDDKAHVYLLSHSWYSSIRNYAITKCGYEIEGKGIKFYVFKVEKYIVALHASCKCLFISYLCNLLRKKQCN